MVWCGEQCVAVMAASSGCQQFATEPTVILPSGAPRLLKRLKVTLNLQHIIKLEFTNFFASLRINWNALCSF